MSKIIVSNWKEVYKSLAVWLPILATTAYVGLQNTTEAGLVPDSILPIVVGITGVLGWVIAQKSIRK